MAKWVEQTPPGFVFAPKANQGITHYGRLKNAAERLERFYTAIAPLGDRLGPVLFQCPPNLKYEPDVLAGFLADLAAEPAAKGHERLIEPRHPSWFTGEAAAQLHEAGVALVRRRHRRITEDRARTVHCARVRLSPAPPERLPAPVAGPVGGGDPLGADRRRRRPRLLQARGRRGRSPGRHGPRQEAGYYQSTGSSSSAMNQSAGTVRGAGDQPSTESS